jgi:hypothetical protein
MRRPLVVALFRPRPPSCLWPVVHQTMTWSDFSVLCCVGCCCFYSGWTAHTGADDVDQRQKTENRLQAASTSVDLARVFCCGFEAQFLRP